MLLETPYKNGDTVSLKLSAGEEIIARLEEETDDFVKLHKPMALVAQGQGIGLAPFMFSVNPDAKFKINTKSIVCIVKTEEGLASQYTEKTTGIVT